MQIRRAELSLTFTRLHTTVEKDGLLTHAPIRVDMRILSVNKDGVETKIADVIVEGVVTPSSERTWTIDKDGVVINERDYGGWDYRTGAEDLMVPADHAGFVFEYMVHPSSKNAENARVEYNYSASLEPEEVLPTSAPETDSPECGAW